jgi:hypothetical protein
MKEQTFSLKPFEGASPDVEIKGRAVRDKNILTVHYELAGNLQDIDIPARNHKPSRVKGLWENTCFELFAAAGDESPYREFNLSPSGDWNVFRFERYEEHRRVADLKEDPLFTALPFRTEKQPGTFSLDLGFSLEGIARTDQPLEIGISAVVKSGTRSFWALAHSGPRPDFHRRDSFVLHL